MKVLITGGAGFIGLLLAKTILARGTLLGSDGAPHEIDAMTLFDQVVPASRPAGLDPRISFAAGEISEAADIARLVDRPDMSIFHLASVVSGGGEKDFDLAMRVNLHGHLHLLDAARALKSKPRYVFASSIAVFGGSAMAPKVGDLAKQTPQTTYGMTKSVGELLVNDYTRKGYIDGRSARLPTVIIRPGKPNAAASSFASGVFREPLNGEDCILPVGPEAVMPLSGYRTIVENFIRLHEMDSAKLGDDRAVGFPALDVTVAEMIESLRRAAGNRKLGGIVEKRDPVIEKIVASWPTGTVSQRALDLGLAQDQSLDSIVKTYIDDHLSGA
jgi:D-erythronate 2-dehydrogenase